MMILDLTGHRYGKLTVLHMRPEKSKAGRVRWVCRCDCGKECIVQGNNMRSGNTKSCGCEGSRTTIGARFITHGISDRRPIYIAWQGMKKRCYEPKDNRYERYGGRGIKVCDEWRFDFKTFYDWSMENGWEKGLSIDRIDNDGNYEPFNCRWATCREQSLNRRSTYWIECNGETLCISDWAKRIGMSKETIKYRLNKGWAVEEALFTEPKISRNHTRENGNE